MAAAPPPAVLNYFRATYPTLVFNSTWLDGCIQYLRETYDDTRSIAGLNKRIEYQLLSSDLSTSVLPPNTNRASLQTRYPASDKAILFTGGGARKASVLFQVVEVEDIANSAASVYEVLKEKREKRRVRLQGLKAENGRNMELDGGGEEGMGQGGGEGEEENEEEEEEEEEEVEEEEPRYGQGKGKGKGKGFKGKKDDKGSKKVKRKDIYSRGAMKMLLSDGENEVWAFERTKIEGLGLQKIHLGIKLLLYDVPTVNGILMLSPANTVVKGGQVEEWQNEAEWTLENKLRGRLRMDPLPPPGAIMPDDLPKPEEDIDLKPRSPSPHPARPAPQRLPNGSHSLAASSSTLDRKSGLSSLASQKPSRSASSAKPVPPARQPSSDAYFDDNDLDWEAASRGYEEADEDEEEALRMMDMMDRPPSPAEARQSAYKQAHASISSKAPHTTSSAPVKPIPTSSSWVPTTRPANPRGSSMTGISTGHTSLTGKTQVLELGSDGEQLEVEEEDVKPLKRVKREPGTSGGGSRKLSTRGPKKQTTTVLELDDSD
ncbi:hypothetical protein JCM11641_001116 [Rhodosporidiobolus odoratus]